jgi:hypothetical protein
MFLSISLSVGSLSSLISHWGVINRSLVKRNSFFRYINTVQHLPQQESREERLFLGALLFTVLIVRLKTFGSHVLSLSGLSGG